MCTVLNGLPLDTPLSPQEEIRIVPLPLSTADLPRLPTHTGEALTDYLGLSSGADDQDPALSDSCRGRSDLAQEGEAELRDLALEIIPDVVCKLHAWKKSRQTGERDTGPAE